MTNTSTSPPRPGRARRMLAATLAAGAVGTSLFAVTAAGANTPVARATLRDASGQRIGRVRFYNADGHTTVEVKLDAGTNVTPEQFHGFHIHTGSDATIGTQGCIADAAKPSSTWFVSAGGHLKDDGQVHSGHKGDLQSLLVNADGTADATFTTDRFTPSELKGRAIVLHANADNFGNVPVGTAADQYTANSAAAVTKTQNTGNGGDRLACGVISTGRGDD